MHLFRFMRHIIATFSKYIILTFSSPQCRYQTKKSLIATLCQLISLLGAKAPLELAHVKKKNMESKILESTCITPNHHRSPRIIPDLPGSPRITQDHPESPRITQNLPALPRITLNHPESPRITPNHPQINPNQPQINPNQTESPESP